MKNKLPIVILYIGLLLVFIYAPVVSFAQGPPSAPGGGGAPCGDPYPACIPIDQGTGLLMLVGALFAMYFLLKLRNVASEVK